MRTFTWVSGRVAEVHRFINVPMRWCEQYPARERRELWITTAEHHDAKLVAHTRTMPARCGHEVVCVLDSGQLVGLRNLSTGEQVNFIRSDPPLLLRRCDLAVVAVLLLVALPISCVPWPVVGVFIALCAGLYAPCALSLRWLQRGLLTRATEGAMASATRQATARRRLWRVK